MYLKVKPPKTIGTGLIVIVVGLAFAGLAKAQTRPASAAAIGASETARAAPVPINLRKTVTVEVVAKTKDAVVNVSATKLINRRISPFGLDPVSYTHLRAHETDSY